MRGLLHTAGERVELTCAVPWITDILTEGAAGQLTAADGITPDVRVTVERELRGVRRHRLAGAHPRRLVPSTAR